MNNFDEDDLELLDESTEDSLTDEEAELAGSLDGEFDAEYSSSEYSGYASSADLNDLTDDQKELYDAGYHSGYDLSDRRNQE